MKNWNGLQTFSSVRLQLQREINISVYLYVPENMENFREDVTLRNRLTGEVYELTDEGAVISERQRSFWIFRWEIPLPWSGRMRSFIEGSGDHRKLHGTLYLYDSQGL